MKECFVISGPASCGNRFLAAVLVNAGCAGYASTDHQEWYPTVEKKAVIIRHWLSDEVFNILGARGYTVTVLIPVRDNVCAEASRQNKKYGDNLVANHQYQYRHTFEVIPGHINFQMVSYESLVHNGPSLLLESLGLPPAHPPYGIDNHFCSRIIDANAKYYGTPRPEDDSFNGDDLVWLPEKGIGFYPVKDKPYDAEYFNKYVAYSETECGRKVTESRVDFVNKHYTGGLMDIGIGCGDFISTRGHTCGFDVNPVAVEWLKERGLLADPRYSQYPAATFWDSLEHINDPGQVLQNITDYVFVSMPIFDGPEHIIKSKHFRKDEHFWYFTKEGFANWMADKGFKLLEVDDFETRLGREDILTFAFRRMS